MAAGCHRPDIRRSLYSRVVARTSAAPLLSLLLTACGSSIDAIEDPIEGGDDAALDAAADGVATDTRPGSDARTDTFVDLDAPGDTGPLDTAVLDTAPVDTAP